jgi:hypothetical protein
MDVGMKWKVIEACRTRDIVILDEQLARRYQESNKRNFQFSIFAPNRSNCARDEPLVQFP